MVDNVQYDFTYLVVGNITTVTLTAPVGSFVTISMTIGYDNPIGTAVYNATKIASDPVQRVSPSLVVIATPAGAGGIGLAGQPIPSPAKPATGPAGRTGRAGTIRRLASPLGVMTPSQAGVIITCGPNANGVATTGLAGATTLGPSFALDFLTPNVLDPHITFARTSNASYIDATGTMRTVGANIPRWDYDPSTHICVVC